VSELFSVMKKIFETVTKFVVSPPSLQVGDRVELTRNHLRNPEHQRRGVVAKITSRHQENFYGNNSEEEIVVVCLDFPLVTQVDEFSKYFACLLRTNPKNIYVIPLSRVENSLAIKKLDWKKANVNTMVRCVCCGKIQSADNLFSMANRAICKAHVCLWNEEQREPLVERVGVLYSRLFDIAEKGNFQPANFPEARTLMYFSQFEELLLDISSSAYRVKQENRITSFFRSLYFDNDFDLQVLIDEKLVVHKMTWPELQTIFVGSSNQMLFQACRISLQPKELIPKTKKTMLHRSQSEVKTDTVLALYSPRFPAIRHNSVDLIAGSSVDKIWNYLQNLPFPITRDDFKLCLWQSDSLFGRIKFCMPFDEVPCAAYGLQYCLGPEHLDISGTLEIYEQHPVVGPPLLFKALAGNFPHNVALIGKTQELMKTYHGFRSIKGDGNCYFRTIMYGFLEQILCLETARRDVCLLAFEEKLQKLPKPEVGLIAYLRTFLSS
jgi:hypothetical protein